MKNRSIIYGIFLTVFFVSFHVIFFPKDAKCTQIYSAKRINFDINKIKPLSNVWHRISSKKVNLNIMAYATKAAYLKAIVANNDIIFRLKWYDPRPVFKIKSPNQFVDGAAIAFPLSPVKGFLPPICMGGSGLKNEVNIWHFRANFINGYAENLISGGTGTLTISADPLLHQIAKWKNGYWYVEFFRPLKDKNGVMLNRSKIYYIAVGVWNGFDRERAMKKSVSYWFPIKIN